MAFMDAIGSDQTIDGAPYSNPTATQYLIVSRRLNSHIDSSRIEDGKLEQIFLCTSKLAYVSKTAQRFKQHQISQRDFTAA